MTITDSIMSAIVRGSHLAFCTQHHGIVPRDEFDKEAQMCNDCVSDAFNEMAFVLESRGLVASAEEEEAND